MYQSKGERVQSYFYNMRRFHNNIKRSLYDKYTKNIDKLDEEDLDNYILPHPLIGKTTIREMLYFTIYHVQHHHKAIVDNSN